MPIDNSQNRKKQAKNRIAIHDLAIQRTIPLLASRRLEDSVAMEYLLDLVHIVDEGRAAFHRVIARPRQIDIDDAVDAPRARGDDADPAGQLHRFLDAVSDEDDGRLA